jgi:hypothetical protein
VGLDLKDFFLLLSSTGLAYRRCELVRVDGDRMGVAFLREQKKKNEESARTGPLNETTVDFRTTLRERSWSLH